MCRILGISAPPSDLETYTQVEFYENPDEAVKLPRVLHLLP